MLVDLVVAMQELGSDPAFAHRRLQAVWLFGSQARGDAGPESDLDLGILCDPPLEAERLALADRLGNILGVDVDAIDLPSSSAVLTWEIVTSGRLILERDPQVAEQFVRHARFAVEDEQRRLRMILLAQTTTAGDDAP